MPIADQSSPQPAGTNVRAAVTALACIAIAGLAACSDKPPPAPPRVTDVTAMSITTRDAPVDIEFVAQTRSTRSVSPAAGAPATGNAAATESSPAAAAAVAARRILLLRKREDIERPAFGRAFGEVLHRVDETQRRGLVAGVKPTCDDRARPAADA